MPSCGVSWATELIQSLGGFLYCFVFSSCVESCWWSPVECPILIESMDCLIVRFVLVIDGDMPIFIWELTTVRRQYERMFTIRLQQHCHRGHFVHAPSQWETTLHRNVVSHWLGACTKLSLQQVGVRHQSLWQYVNNVITESLVSLAYIYVWFCRI